MGGEELANELCLYMEGVTRKGEKEDHGDNGTILYYSPTCIGGDVVVFSCLKAAAGLVILEWLPTPALRDSQLAVLVWLL